MSDDKEQTEKIRKLNDHFRRTFEGGRVVITAGVDALGYARVRHLLDKVRTFEHFGPDNDPHGEHDFGAFDDDGQRYFFKIDYYSRNLEAGSENPADPAVTVRVLTLMLAEEY